MAPKVRVADITHVASWLIASRTELLRSSNLFPFSSWSRAVQMSAQASPSSTQSARLINLSWVHSDYNRSTKTGRKLTLIVARMMLTVPKRALACATPEESFARFKVSMAVFNSEIAPFRSLGRWDSTFMVETRGSRERTV